MRVAKPVLACPNAFSFSRNNYGVFRVESCTFYIRMLMLHDVAVGRSDVVYTTLCGRSDHDDVVTRNDVAVGPIMMLC